MNHIVYFLKFNFPKKYISEIIYQDDILKMISIR